MRFNLDSPPLKQARKLLDDKFESLLPSQDVLADALAANEHLDVAKGFAANAGQIVQHVQGRLGIQTGVPSNLVAGFAQILSTAALEQTGSNAGIAIAQASGQLIMDAALQAAGSIPIMGWAVNLAMSLASLGQAAASQNKPYPPALAYNQAVDNHEAQKALEIIGSVHAVQDVDWTPLFLPRRSGNWDAYPVGAGAGSGAGPDGWAFHPISTEGDGLGCVPPGMFGSRQVQVRDVHNGLKRFAKGRSMTEWYKENVFDAFQFLPSLARIGQAAWYAAGSNDTAAVWNFDYDRIRKAWLEYFKEGMELAYMAEEAGQKVPKGQRRLHPIANTPYMQGRSLLNAMAHASRAGDKELKSKPNPSNNSVSGWANLWCALYNDRARAMCKTAVVAYGSFEQAWFKAPDNRKAFVEGWKDLLQHPAVKAIDPNDIPDYSFRQAAVAVGAGTRDPKDFPGWPVIGTSPPPQRVAAPVGLSASVGGSGSGIVLVGAAALAGAGAWAFSRRGK